MVHIKVFIMNINIKRAFLLLVESKFKFAIFVLSARLIIEARLICVKVLVLIPHQESCD